LDHEHLAVRRVDGELDVATARFDADLADDGDRGIAHALVLAVRECHGGRHGDRIAGVHAHGVHVLDRAYDHHVVPVIAPPPGPRPSEWRGHWPRSAARRTAPACRPSRAPSPRSGPSARPWWGAGRRGAPARSPAAPTLASPARRTSGRPARGPS